MQHWATVEAGHPPKRLMAMPPAMHDDKWQPDLAGQVTRTLARDKDNPTWGHWCLDNCYVSNLPLLWLHLGDRFTARDVMRWYRSLTVYALKRRRTTNMPKPARLAKKQQWQAAKETLKSLMARWDLPRVEDRRGFVFMVKHVEAAMLARDKELMRRSISAEGLPLLHISNRGLIRFRAMCVLPWSILQHMENVNENTEAHAFVMLRCPSFTAAEVVQAQADQEVEQRRWLAARSYGVTSRATTTSNMRGSRYLASIVLHVPTRLEKTCKATVARGCCMCGGSDAEHCWPSPTCPGQPPGFNQ